MQGIVMPQCLVRMHLLQALALHATGSPACLQALHVMCDCFLHDAQIQLVSVEFRVLKQGTQGVLHALCHTVLRYVCN
jgi:hypothetical protein